MARLIENFNWGSALVNSNPELTRQLSEAFFNTARVVNAKPNRYVTDGKKYPNVNPPANSPFNIEFEISDFYVRSDTNTAWIMTSRTSSTAVTWTQIT